MSQPKDFDLEVIRESMKRELWDILVRYQDDYGVFLFAADVNSMQHHTWGGPSKRVYTKFEIEVGA